MSLFSGSYPNSREISIVCELDFLEVGMAIECPSPKFIYVQSFNYGRNDNDDQTCV